MRTLGVMYAVYIGRHRLVLHIHRNHDNFGWSAQVADMTPMALEMPVKTLIEFCLLCIYYPYYAQILRPSRFSSGCEWKDAV